MKTAQYLLAKYVPDLARMEPRNIGVIVWSKGRFCSRFLDKADIRSIHVNNPDTYERWVSYWTRLVAADSIRPRRGRPVSTGDPECINALLTTQKGNYILVDSGEVLGRLKTSELQEATDYLFEDLVAIQGSKDGKERLTFPLACETVFQDAGVEFKTQPSIECNWNGIKRTLHPDYYVGNGRPDAIFHRAKLSNESNVNGGLFLVQSLIADRIVVPEACRFLIRKKDLTTSIAEEGLELCRHLCGIIDIEEPDAAQVVRQVASAKS